MIALGGPTLKLGQHAVSPEMHLVSMIALGGPTLKRFLTVGQKSHCLSQ